MVLEQRNPQPHEPEPVEPRHNALLLAIIALFSAAMALILSGREITGLALMGVDIGAIGYAYAEAVSMKK